MNFQTYNKAIVALAVPAILAVLSAVGITPDMRIDDAVAFVTTAVVTAIFVYLVPNRY